MCYNRPGDHSDDELLSTILPEAIGQVVSVAGRGRVPQNEATNQGTHAGGGVGGRRILDGNREQVENDRGLRADDSVAPDGDGRGACAGETRSEGAPAQVFFPPGAWGVVFGGKV